MAGPPEGNSSARESGAASLQGGKTCSALKQSGHLSLSIALRPEDIDIMFYNSKSMPSSLSNHIICICSNHSYTIVHIAFENERVATMIRSQPFSGL